MAKRRRINYQNLAIAGIVLIVLAGAAFLASKTIFKPKPDKYIAAAKADIAAGRWESAVKNITAGIRYSTIPNPNTWILFGEAASHLTVTDSDAEGQMAFALRQALEIDPTNSDALHRMLVFNQDHVMRTGSRVAGAHEGVRDVAAKILAVDPKDKAARLAIHGSIIDQWQAGIETDPKKVDEAMVGLQELQAEEPANADITLYLTRVRLSRASEAARLGNPKEARQLADEAEKIINDALKDQADNARMHFAAAQVYRQLAFLPIDRDARTTSKPLTTRPQAMPEMAGREAMARMLDKYRRAGDEIRKASDLVKPEDEKFVDIRLSYAELNQTAATDQDTPRETIEKISRENREKVEALLKETLTARPNEPQVRDALADLIAKNPQRRDEAIALLQSEIKPSDRWIGGKGILWKNSQIGSLAALSELRLDRLETLRDKPERDKALIDVQTGYDKLVSIAGGENWWRVLQIKARIQMSRGEAVDATQTLNRALGTYPTDNYSNERYELMFRLAQAYLTTQQSGEAKKLLRDIVAAKPTGVPARLLLVDTLLKEGNIQGTPPLYNDGALAQADALEKLLGPEHPTVIRVRLLTLDPEKDAEKIGSYYANLPETNTLERFDKATMAARLQKTDEAIRLLKVVYHDEPSSLQVINLLLQLYGSKGDRDSAIGLLKEAVAKNPQSKSLAVALAQAEAPETAGDERRRQAESIEDPLRRVTALANYFQDEGDDAKAMEQWQAAEKAAPDNANVWERLFAGYLQSKEYDKAAVYLERLAKKNADQADGQIYRTRFLMAQGKVDEAYEQALKLTQIRSEFAQSWVLLGGTLQAKGKFDEAISAFQQAQDRQTENLDAIRGLIGCFMSLDRPGKASDEATGQRATDAKLYIELAQRLYPNAQTFKEMGFTWEMRYGDPERVIAPRQAIVKKYPDQQRAWADLASAYLAAAQAKNKNAAPGQILPAAKDYLGKAKETLTEASDKFKDEPRFALMLVDTNVALKDYDAGEKLLLEVAGREAFKDKAETASMVANFYIRAGKPEKSEQTLRDYLAANPAAVQVQALLANQLARARKTDEALKVLEANADNDLIRGARIDTLLGAGRNEEAGKYVDAAIAANKTPALVKLRARIDMVQGDFAGARSRLDQVLAKDGNDLEAILLRGRLSASDPRGDVSAAIDDFNRIVSLPANQVDPRLQLEARVQLADAYKRRHLDDDAARVLESAVRATSDDSPNARSLRLKLLDFYTSAQPPRWVDAEHLLKDTKANHPQLADDPDLMNGEAKMWLARKDPDKALKLVQMAMEKSPDNLTYTLTYFDALIESRDYKTLLTASDKSIKAHPDLARLYEQRAIARKRGQNDRSGAMAEFATGLKVAAKANDDPALNDLVRRAQEELGPGDTQKLLAPFADTAPKWQILLANVQLSGGDAIGALATIEKVLANPNLGPSELPTALNMAGSIYLSQSPQNLIKAIDSYRRVVKEVPTDLAALNNLAYLLLEPGPTYAPSEAVTYSQRVYDLMIRSGSSDPLILDTHGWALVLAGRVDEGISLLRTALEKKSFVDAHYHLGEALLKMSPPQAVDAERAFLDARRDIDESERASQKVDEKLKAQVQVALERAQQLKK